jgi:hypothetical protein
MWRVAGTRSVVGVADERQEIAKHFAKGVLLE